MTRILVIGGGWAGCAAALAARQAGSDVVLLERTDCLLGTGLVGGIFRNNGRFTAAEEMIAMGGGALFQLMDRAARHRDIEFPGHRHASIYDVLRMEPMVRRAMEDAGIEVRMQTRATNVLLDGDCLTGVQIDDGQTLLADAFVEATGTAGPPANCQKHGNGCAMCILRCMAFGPRVSIAAKAGVRELAAIKADGSQGAMSGACKLLKESLDRRIVRELEAKGVVIIPLPRNLTHSDKLHLKACQQYALPDYAENLILLDSGHAKLMTPFMPLDDLRRVPGMAEARYDDPYAGGKGNSMRFFAMSPRDDALKVQGLQNLFCAGEKAGLLVGHTEAVCTGVLAGHNAAHRAVGLPARVIPTSTAVGDAIAYVRTQMASREGLAKKYTFSGSVYFDRMKELGLYTIDIGAIGRRVQEAGMLDFFNAPIQDLCGLPA